jgi:hypothetical protein
MTAQTIQVPLSDLAILGDILGAIDFEQSETVPNKAISTLVDKAHETIISLMGEHATKYYAEEEAS